MKTVNKFETKRTIKRLFEAGGVKQIEMADALHMGESYLSRVLSPTDELDGFYYGYLRVMGYLADRYPQVFNNVDSHAQTVFDGWRKPQHGLVEAQSANLYALDISTVTTQLWEAVITHKPDVEIKAILATLSALSADFQRSLALEMQETPG